MVKSNTQGSFQTRICGALRDRLPTAPAMQWQRVDNKPAVVIAALGSGFVLWLSFSVLGALRFLPLVRRVVAKGGWDGLHSQCNCL